MIHLTGTKKKYLRGLAHALSPVLLIGKEGITDGVVRAADAALSQHELIKVKFNDFKEKSQKVAIVERLAASTGSCLVGMIGHTATLFRPQPDPEKRKIQLPGD